MRGLALRRSWPFALWLIALALAPWWLGLPLLLGAAALLLAGVERLQPFHGTLRLALRWGVAGMAFALGRSFAEPALAWTVAAVAVLAGYTLLAGLESWLDRARRRASLAGRAPVPAAHEWPGLMLAPVAAGETIVELVPPRWQPCEPSALALPSGAPGGHVRYVREAGFAGFRLDDGAQLAAAPGRCAIAPEGAWLAFEAAPGVLLWDRETHRRHRLLRRHLCGWHHGQPWLQSGVGDMPVPLAEALEREPAG